MFFVSSWIDRNTVGANTAMRISCEMHNKKKIMNIKNRHWIWQVHYFILFLKRKKKEDKLKIMSTKQLAMCIGIGLTVHIGSFRFYR